jgi:hypothetical protein
MLLFAVGLGGGTVLASLKSSCHDASGSGRSSGATWRRVVRGAMRPWARRIFQIVRVERGACSAGRSGERWWR